MSSFFAELKRRNVYKVGAMYAVAGWLLAQVVTQILPVFGVSMFGQRLLVLILIAGFPVALVLAWLFDLTPQGIVRTGALPAGGESAATVSGRRGMNHRLNYVLGGLLLLSLAGLIAVHYGLVPTALPQAPAAAAAGKSIAVLPFTNTSSDTGNEFFSDGLSEELISSLSRLHDLKVIGRTSSFQFKGSNEDSKTIGDKLGVVYLLEGSVRKSSDRVRIAVELVQSADGASVWSESYDRQVNDIFAVQSEIAGAVAGQLQVALLGGNAQALQTSAAAASPTQNVGAYTALLQGNFHFNRDTESDLRQAIDYYSQAIRLEPNNAQAYAGLSSAYSDLASTWLGGDEAAADYDKARSAALMALRLAPDLSIGHGAYALLLSNADFEDPAARATLESEYRRAEALAPAAADPKLWLGQALVARGHRDEGLALIRQGLALDPLNTEGYVQFGRILVGMKQYDEAEALLRKGIELQPSASRLHVTLAALDLVRGQWDAAMAEARLEPAGFWRDYVVALALQKQKDHAAADAALNQLIGTYASSGPMQIATVYALRQEPDRVFEWLNKGIEAKDPGVYWLLLIDPFIQAYRNDPRYAAFCLRLGLDPAAQA
jgi:serine/threonine-protein kinase